MTAGRQEPQPVTEQQGTSPGTPQRIDPTAVGQTPQPPPEAEPAVYGVGGVTWEERRKGLPPQQPRNPDEWIWNDRFTSEMEAIGLPNPAWRDAKGDVPGEESLPLPEGWDTGRSERQPGR